MSKDTYIIEYGVYFTNNHYESHTIKVKNCMSELHSKIKLEEYLKKKHDNYKSMVVYKCTHDFLGLFDMMGKNNPFGF